MKSSYPYRFALGQLGHLGQIAKTLANRSFNAPHPHIYTGTALGHAGTLHFQDVSGQANGLKYAPRCGLAWPSASFICCVQFGRCDPLTAPAIYPGRLAGPGHWAGVRMLRSAATSPGAVHRFDWRQSPGVQPPGIGRRVPAWHTQHTAAGHRSAVRAKQCRAGFQLPGLLLCSHFEGRHPPKGPHLLAASRPNQSSSDSNNAGRI